MRTFSHGFVDEEYRQLSLQCNQLLAVKLASLEVVEGCRPDDLGHPGRRLLRESSVNLKE